MGIRFRFISSHVVSSPMRSHTHTFATCHFIYPHSQYIQSIILILSHSSFVRFLLYWSVPRFRKRRREPEKTRNLKKRTKMAQTAKMFRRLSMASPVVPCENEKRHRSKLVKLDVTVIFFPLSLPIVLAALAQNTKLYFPIHWLRNFHTKCSPFSRRHNFFIRSFVSLMHVGPFSPLPRLEKQKTNENVIDKWFQLFFFPSTDSCHHNRNHWCQSTQS